MLLGYIEDLFSQESTNSKNSLFTPNSIDKEYEDIALKNNPAYSGIRKMWSK